jgi:ABC-2 type transport system permease protein
MVVVNGVGAHGAGGGVLGREARVQYAAMAGLRWRMFMNGLRSINGLFDLGTTGVAWTLYSVLGLGMGLGLCGAAHAMAAHASWQYLPVLFWVTSFLWLMFPMMVASFQEQPELRILLRFPVGFVSYFLLHVISGLMEASTIVGGFCCLGIWIGIFIARPDLYGWTALTLVLFAIFNVLLVRAVFAWIDRWLAQRKTREILGAAFMVLFVGLLVANSIWSQKRAQTAGYEPHETTPFGGAVNRYGQLLGPARGVEQWLPPGMGARTIRQAVERRPEALIASLSLLGMWTVVAGGVLAGRLRGEYRGQNLSWAPSRGKATRRDSGWRWGGTGPFVAILEKEVRSLSRTVPLLWAMSMPALIVPVLAGAFHPGNPGNSFPYAFPLCVAYALLGFTGLFYNSLGVEGAGIQLLFLSPTPIRTVLLAKNLLHSILFVLVGIGAGALSCIRLGVPSLVVLAGTGAWLAFALPCNLAAGIVFSLAVPYRINPGRITRPAGAQANSLPATLIQMGVLGVGVLVFWLCWSMKEPWLAVPIFLALGLAASLAWVRILHHSDENANQRRDLLIATLMKTE